MNYAFTVAGKTHNVLLEEHADGPKFVVEGTSFQPEVKKTADGIEVTIEGETFLFRVGHGRIENAEGPLDLKIHRARPVLARSGKAGRKGDGRIKPPMPGKIVEVPVAVGQEVAAGEVVIVLEAMKMQNDIKSPFAGKVSKVHVSDGANVEATTILVEVEPHPED